MLTIITNKFRLNNAEQFQESFSETAATVYYLGIGRAQNFGTITRPDARTDYEGTETAPTTPGDSVLNEFKNFDDLLDCKENYRFRCFFLYTKKKLDNRYYIRYLQTRL